MNVFNVFNFSHLCEKGALSQVLQEYAKSVMHRKLEPVPEEREADVEGLPTSPSQIQQEELTGPPTGDKTRPPSVTKPTKPAAEVILKRIKPQVPFILKSVFCAS